MAKIVCNSSRFVDDDTNDHIYSGKILMFQCPVCHNRTVVDTECDVHNYYDVGYDDLCICEECGSEFYARPSYDHTVKFKLAEEVEDELEDRIWSSKSIKASWYDYEDADMFPKEDLIEFADDIVDDFNAWVGKNASYDLSDLVWDEKNNLILDISDGEFEFEASVRIDFRRVRVLSDLQKYRGRLLEQFKDQYQEYTEVYTSSAASPNMEKIKSELYNKAFKVMQGPGFGFPEDEVSDYLFVDASKDRDGMRFEVRAELSYDGMVDLADALDKVIQRYFPEAYFDQVEPGIMEAYVWNSEIKGCNNSPVYSSYHEVSDEARSLNEQEVDLSDFENRGPISRNRRTYTKYCRSIEDRSGKRRIEWAAQDQDGEHPAFRITYDQARGYEPIEKYDSDIDDLAKDLGRQLLPTNSSRKITSAESADFEEYEDEIQEIDQEFTSENTSINSTKLPAVFKMVSFEPGTVNIDYGGGKFDNVADYLSQYDVINLVYDPYNRSPEHNKEVIQLVREHGGADTATCSNVLNVIKEAGVRINVLKNIKKLVKPEGEVYITVYEGSGKGDEGPTKSGYQLNRRTADYLEEIRQVFPDAIRKGKLIVAHPSGSPVSSSVRSRSSKVVAASAFGEDSDTYFQVYGLTSEGDRDDHLEDFDDLDSAVNYAKSICKDGPCEIVEIETNNRGLQKTVCRVNQNGAVTYTDSTSVLSADYGGAYDIDPHEFFTRDDLMLLADDVVEKASSQSGVSLLLSDAYIVDYARVVIDVCDTSGDYWASGQARVDMRRIRRPSDILKYSDTIVSQIVDELEDLMSNAVESSADIHAGNTDNMIMDGEDVVMAYHDSSYGVSTIHYDDEVEYSTVPEFIDHLYPDFEDVLTVTDDIDFEHRSFEGEPCMSEEHSGLQLDDDLGLDEKVRDLIYDKYIDNLEPGTYRVSGYADLAYRVSGVEETSDESYYDSASVEYLPDQSSIEKIDITKLS